MSSVVEAPSVVAVVATTDPGPWFEETLAALGGQDYPTLSILVVDNGSTVDITPRVAAVLPGAYVRRLTESLGYAAAVNEVLQTVEGAAMLVVCHDDAAPDPDAIRLMVEEGYRSNAGIVSPKYVEWDEPERLVRVGGSVDKGGYPVPTVEPGELDHEQHDAVRDTFMAPGGCLLIRADLFAALGGFDPVIELCGEDLDFSWRAQVAGARVIVAPAARVRHLEASSHGRRNVSVHHAPKGARATRVYLRSLRARHRLRTALKCYSLPHLARVLPQLIVLHFAEAFYGVITGQFAITRSVFNAWRWNLSHWSSLRRARRVVQRQRVVADGQLRQLQTKGSARFLSFVRGQIVTDARARQISTVRKDFIKSLQFDSRLGLFVGGFVLFIWIVGFRGLIGHIPHVGELQPFPAWSTTIHHAISSTPARDLARPGLNSPAFAVLAAGGIPVLGHLGLLRALLVLGMFPLGVAGVARLSNPLQSKRARLVAVLVYTGIPVGYGALAQGRWMGVLMYGAAPWLLLALFRATGLEPYSMDPEPAPDPNAFHTRLPTTVNPVRAEVAPVVPAATTAATVSAPTAESIAESLSESATHPPLHLAEEAGKPGWRHYRQDVVRMAVLFGLVGAFVPAGLGVIGIGLLALIASTLVIGKVVGTTRAIAVSLAASVGAAILLLPWTALVLHQPLHLDAFGLMRNVDHPLSLSRIFRLQAGPIGNSWFGYAVFVAASLPLLIGRGWRLGWAVRSWLIALACLASVWASGHGWIRAPYPDVAMVVAGAALAYCAALGVLSFERDLARFRFGLRQLAAPAAAVALIITTLPVLVSSFEGRWDIPHSDFDEALSWMPHVAQSTGAFRTLWVGPSNVLPMHGWELDDHLSYATVRNGTVNSASLWAETPSADAVRVKAALHEARAREGRELGRDLEPLGIRYIAVPIQLGNDDNTKAISEHGLLDTLDGQLDLSVHENYGGVVIYENRDWQPGHAKVTLASASTRNVNRGLTVVMLLGWLLALFTLYRLRVAEAVAP